MKGKNHVSSGLRYHRHDVWAEGVNDNFLLHEHAEEQIEAVVGTQVP